MASSYLNLAGCLAQMAKLDESLAYMEKSKAIFVANYGPDHPHVATCLNNIAGILFASAKYEKAVEKYNESLGMREKLFGDEARTNESVAMNHENLGLCAIKVCVLIALLH